MNTVNDSKRSAIRDSAYEIVKSAENYFAVERYKNLKYKGETF